MLSMYQYSRENLEDVITNMCPKWREAGQRLPEALKDAIVSHWLTNDDEYGFHRCVMESAWRDLQTHGQFKFKV